MSYDPTRQSQSVPPLRIAPREICENLPQHSQPKQLVDHPTGGELQQHMSCSAALLLSPCPEQWQEVPLPS